MGSTRCLCMAHYERDDDGRLILVVDFPDPDCIYPHKETHA